MIHHANMAEPGDAELMDYDLPDALMGYAVDEHVDGCDCDACRVMWVKDSDDSYLVVQHRALAHAVLVDDCPLCQSYDVEEVRAPNDWDDVPF